MIRARILWHVHWNAVPPTYEVAIPHADNATRTTIVTIPLAGGPFANKHRASEAALAHLMSLSDADLTAYFANQSRRFATDN